MSTEGKRPLQERVLAVLLLLFEFGSVPGCSTAVIKADGVNWVSKARRLTLPSEQWSRLQRIANVQGTR